MSLALTVDPTPQWNAFGMLRTSTERLNLASSILFSPPTPLSSFGVPVPTSASTFSTASWTPTLLIQPTESSTDNGLANTLPTVNEFAALLEMIQSQSNDSLLSSLEHAHLSSMTYPLSAEPPKPTEQPGKEQAVQSKSYGPTHQACMCLINSHNVLLGNSATSVHKKRDPQTQEKTFFGLFDYQRDRGLLKETTTLLCSLFGDPNNEEEQARLLGLIAINKSESPVLQINQESWMTEVLCCVNTLGIAEEYVKYVDTVLDLGLVHSVFEKSVKRVMGRFKSSSAQFLKKAYAHSNSNSTTKKKNPKKRNNADADYVPLRSARRKSSSKPLVQARMDDFQDIADTEVEVLHTEVAQS